MNKKIGAGFEILRHFSVEDEFASDVRIIFVINGKLEVKVEENIFELTSEDVILINQCNRYSVREIESSIVAIVEYSPRCIKEMLGTDIAYFFCSSQQEKNRSYSDIHEIFYSLIYEYTYQVHESNSYQMSLLLKLLDVLVERYLLKGNSINISQEDEKVRKLIHYVNVHYQDEINLTNLAEELYASTSTISRLFKKRTGVYFADYVNSVRCKFAAAQLIETECTITKVSGDCGFSNPSVFNKIFKSIYGCTPSEYRNKYIEEKKSEKVFLTDTDRIKEELKKTNIFSDVESNEKNITLDLRNIKRGTLKQTWNKIINIGSFQDMSLANVQQHALFLREHLGFRYVRMWSLFSKNMMFTDGKTGSGYNYDKIDQVLDFLNENEILPFIDFGNKPNAILSSKNSIRYENDYIEFENRDAWQNAISDFFIHCLRRYGKANVSKWIIEVTYDKRHFQKARYYQASDYSFYELYEFIYRTAKQSVPGIKVCGYSSIIQEDGQDFLEFSLKVKKNNCIPDMMTFLLLPYVEKTDSNGKKYLALDEDENYEKTQLGIIRDAMKKTGLSDCSIVITELNNSISNRNHINDSCWRSTFLVRKILGLWDSVESIGVLMGSDWISSFYDSIGVVTGSIGLLSKNTIRKPAYFAIKFLNRMQGDVIYKDENILVTKKNNGGFYILCNNGKQLNKNYYANGEDVSLSKKMDKIFCDWDNLVINLFMENVENGEYTIKKRTVNEKHGSILNEWEKLQYSKDLSSSDILYLKNLCVPKLSIETLNITENNMMLNFDLEPNELSFIHIYKH